MIECMNEWMNESRSYDNKRVVYWHRARTRDGGGGGGDDDGVGTCTYKDRQSLNSKRKERGIERIRVVFWPLGEEKKVTRSSPLLHCIGIALALPLRPAWALSLFSPFLKKKRKRKMKK